MLDRILNKLDSHNITHTALLFDFVVIQSTKRWQDIWQNMTSLENTCRTILDTMGWLPHMSHCTRHHAMTTAHVTLYSTPWDDYCTYQIALARHHGMTTAYVTLYSTPCNDYDICRILCIVKLRNVFWNFYQAGYHHKSMSPFSKLQ